MIKMNNKGQTLVMFVILLPIFLLIITLVYDFGNALYEKERLDNTNYMVIEYGLDNIDNISENDLIDLVMKNTSNLDSIYVLIDDSKITIKLSKNVRGIVGGIFGFKLIEINSNYEGNISQNEKRIERIKWYYGR